MLRVDEVDAWIDAREEVVQVVFERGSASLDQVASLSSSLLRQCQGSVTLFLSTTQPLILAIVPRQCYLFSVHLRLLIFLSAY